MLAKESVQHTGYVKILLLYNFYIEGVMKKEYFEYQPDPIAFIGSGHPKEPQ